MKSLCGYKKEDIANKLKKITKIVQKPKYICKKCARVAKGKEYLCLAIKLEK